MKQVIYQINQLTNDEDYRQELIVHYLQYNDINSLSPYLEKLKIEAKLSSLEYNSYDVSRLIVDFTEFEQRVISLLLIGLNVNEISIYFQVHAVYIIRTIENIKNHSRWKKCP